LLQLFIKPTKAYYVYAVITSYCLKNVLMTLLLIWEMHVARMGEHRCVQGFGRET